MTPYEIFYYRAKAFCNFVETHKIIKKEDYPCWIIQLIDLYRNTLALEYPLTITSSDNIDSNIFLTSETSDFYWTLCTPSAFEEPVGGSLIDDIQDIYGEIKRGIILAQTNAHSALWEWKFGFDNHWGNHAIDAIRALHYMIRE